MKTQNDNPNPKSSGLAAEFLRAAGTPREEGRDSGEGDYHQWRWCPGCGTRQYHTSEIYGTWERFICRHCGWETMTRVG